MLTAPSRWWVALSCAHPVNLAVAAVQRPPGLRGHKRPHNEPPVAEERKVVDPQEITEELEHPGARNLLASATLLRLAYNGSHGFPE